LTKHIYKTSNIIQMEATECGAVSLKLLLAYYGKYVTIDELRYTCGITRDGASCQKLIDAANEYGVKLTFINWDRDTLLKEYKGPTILWWDFNHFLVFEGYKNSNFYLSDPAIGRRIVNEETFYAKYTDYCLKAELDDSFTKGGSPEKYILDYIRRYRSQLSSYLLILVLSLLSAIPETSIAVLIGFYSDKYISGVSQYQGNTSLWLLLILVLVYFGITYLRLTLLRRVSFLQSGRTSLQFIIKILSLPYNFFVTRNLGELNSRIVQDISSTAQFHTQFLYSLFNALRAVPVTVLLFFISPILTLIPIGLMVISICLSYTVYLETTNDNRNASMSTGKGAGLTFSLVGDIETVRATANESYYFGRWSGFFLASQTLLQVVSSKISVNGSHTFFLSYFTQVLILSLAPILVAEKVITIGDLVTYLLLLPSVLIVFSEISSILNAFKTVDGFSQRFADAFNADTDKFSSLPRVIGSEIPLFKSITYNSSVPSLTSSQKVAENPLVFEQATFAFNPLDPPIIDKASFYVRHGALTSVIGPSGSGKSVLIKIILGLYTLQSGAIYFNGVFLDSNTIQDIRKDIAYVPQEPFIYSATVADNLVHGAVNATNEEILELSKATGFYEIVNQHPQGFNRILNDGGTDLSGGQRQLLQLTRALLRKPQLLLLDEGTSALDNLTESKIISLLNDRNITTLSISHRKTLIDSSSDILTFSNRSISRSGDYDDFFN